MKRYAILVLVPLLACSSSVPAKPKGGCKHTQISETRQLAFGRLGVFTAGTATVSPAGTLTASGGVTEVPGGMVSAGSFDISGCANTVFTIVLPAAAQLKSKADALTIDQFTSTPAGAGVLDANGRATVSVGATLNAAANQPPGDYSGRYTLEVIY